MEMLVVALVWITFIIFIIGMINPNVFIKKEITYKRLLLTGICFVAILILSMIGATIDGTLNETEAKIEELPRFDFYKVTTLGKEYIDSNFGDPEISDSESIYCEGYSPCKSATYKNGASLTFSNNELLNFTQFNTDSLKYDVKEVKKYFGITHKPDNVGEKSNIRWDNLNGYELTVFRAKNGFSNIVITKLNLDQIAKKDLIKKISNHFNEYDGSHKHFSMVILDQMNDPDSYKHIITNYKIKDSEHYYVTTEFSGKNAFGGRVRTTLTGLYDSNSRLIELNPDFN